MKSNSPEIWKRWRPSSDETWNLRRVVHLHRRAGFAATWREIQRDLADGPQAAVNRILSGQTQPNADHSVGPAATAPRLRPDPSRVLSLLFAFLDFLGSGPGAGTAYEPAGTSTGASPAFAINTSPR